MDKKTNYKSVSELIDICEKSSVKISEFVLSEQAIRLEKKESEVYEKMRSNYNVMHECIESGSKKDLKSTSGLTGGSAYKMKIIHDEGRSLSGSFISGALYRALAVSELNASMGRIVAAPTAGSCGILPAAVITMQEEKHLSERECVMSLFTASAIGMIIANVASISGAQGGCQAECGSAAAMAAAAVTELFGGTVHMVGEATAISLKNILGLICDPVAGLVEIPCIKRNASGVAGAFVAAELALAGIDSAIPADEVISAMKKTGDALSPAFKETALGGLAATPTGIRLKNQVFGKDSDQIINCSL